MLLILVVLLVVFILLCKKIFYDQRSANPFRLPPSSKNLGAEEEILPLETNREIRLGVIKKAFNPAQVPENLDAIVIGSGIGGLSTAALLAKAGKKVLVLEQLGKIGGCTHVFAKKTFEFDVGLHYVGQLHPKSQFRMFIDQITDSKLHWVPSDQNYDTVILGNSQDARRYPLCSGGREAFRQNLLKQFPDEHKAIEEYLRLLDEAGRGTSIFAMLKTMPWLLAKLLSMSGILSFLPFFKLANVSVAEIARKLTSNEDLRMVFMYAFGDYGTLPENAPFSLHALVITHYFNGAYYPRGGASEIAFNIVPVIEAAGGKVFAKATVREIIVNEEGQACGVRVAQKKDDPRSKLLEIFAPVIISDAGIVNTFTTLLPPEISLESRYLSYAKKFANSGDFVGVTLFVGLNGSSADLGLKATNYWAFTNASSAIQRDCEAYISLTLEEALKTPPPLLFISFPSAKDKDTWNDRFPGSSSCVVITFARLSWFSKWKDEEVKHRSAEYMELKKQLEDNIWSATCRLFPHLDGRVEYSDIGTPITFQHYLNAPMGELYGLGHGINRFSPEAAVGLRPETDIPGLYLTGQDMMTCGFAGAAYGGILCASSVLRRNLFVDLFRLRQQVITRMRKSSSSRSKQS